jgi:hypothetical protein
VCASHAAVCAMWNLLTRERKGQLRVVFAYSNSVQAAARSWKVSTPRAEDAASLGPSLRSLSGRGMISALPNLDDCLLADNARRKSDEHGVASPARSGSATINRSEHGPPSARPTGSDSGSAGAAL